MRGPLAGVALALAARVAHAQGASTRVDSLRLTDVLARALTQHPLIEAARARVRGAEGTRLTARSLANPVFTWQLENAPLPGGASIPGLPRESSTFATLPLEGLFQRWPRVRAADAGLRAVEAELDFARRSVALDAARAYYRVVLRQAVAQGAADVQDGLAELATFTDARVREGVTSEGDLIRVRVELDRSEAALMLAEAELARSRGGLAPYLGAALSPTDISVVAVRMEDTDAVVPNVGRREGATPVAALMALDDYLARARTARPELRIARARVSAARAESGYQRALTVRQVGVSFGSKRIGDQNTVIAGLSFPLPLFDQNRGEVRRANAEAAAAELELAWRERQVTAEVAAAHQAARLMVERRTHLGDSVVARAEEARRIALAAYREGATSLLQVIDASRTLADLRSAYYQVLVAERESLLELELLSGAELTPAPPPTDTDTRAPGRDGARP
ncbi:MAG: hypothetical protein ABS52_11310 [Gemmatimonadetes bacterium SCN 70-22]|nr:MAG: hypothetical protein ABS52_11310 [Gemmatimonadetes bacterium SCN 70-22]